MTFLDDNQSPLRSRSPSWSELRKRYYQKRCFQKRFLCFWILAALFPFMLLRFVFFYSLSSSGNPAGSARTFEEVRTEELVLRRRSSLMSAGLSPSGHLGSVSEVHHSSLRADNAGKLNDSEGEYGGHEGTGTNSVRLSTPAVSGDEEKKSSGKRFRAVIQEVVDYGSPEDNENEDPMEWILAQKEKVQKKQRGQGVTIDEQDDIMGAEGSARWRADEQMMADVEGDAEEDQVSEEEVDEMWEREQRDSGMNDRKEAGDDYLSLKERETEDSGADGLRMTRSIDEPNELAEGDLKADSEHGDDHAHAALKRAGSKDEEKVAGECNIFDGEWEYDPEGPLYTNSTCFYKQRTQDCMSNGRPDKGYLHWRWKPRECDLPRFDARAFLEAFEGKMIGFVGDSLARNQMQSLLCMLSQVEIPIQTYQSKNDNTVRWLYRQHGVTLAVVWSPYLLKESNEGLLGFERGQSVLYVDVLDTFWTSVMQEFDMIVLSIGQWYSKPSVYVKQDKVIGCHHCPSLNLTEVPFEHVYRWGVRRVLEKLAAEFKGIAVMSSFAIAHFENGTYSKGGQCRRERPLSSEEGEQFRGFHDKMRTVVTSEFASAAKEASRLSRPVKLEFLDVTKMSLLRADGHPGPYRQLDPFQGKNSNEWVPNDCLHWCLPGPIDTWNQLLVKLAQKHL